MFSNASLPNSKVSQQRSKSAHRPVSITKQKQIKKNRTEQQRPEWDVYLFSFNSRYVFYILSFSLIHFGPI